MNRRQEYQRLGAQTRLKQIEQELNEIHAEFPDLLPGGPVTLGPIRKKYVANKQTAAQRMIDAAEKLAAKNGPKSKKAKKSYSRRIPNPNIKTVDPTGETLTSTEAAEMLGLTQSGLDYSVKHGKLRVFQEAKGTGRHGTPRKYLREDIIKLGVSTGRLQPSLLQELQETPQPQAEEVLQ